MKEEYDFTDAEQGKFYCPMEELEIPVYIDKEVQKTLIMTAEKEHKSVSEIVNVLLKNDIAIAESLR